MSAPTNMVLKEAKTMLATYQNFKSEEKRLHGRAEKCKLKILKMLKGIPPKEAALYKEKIDFIITRL